MAAHEKTKLEAIDVVKAKRKELERVFPDVFSEGRIDFDQLKRVLGELDEPSKERFGLSWPGKAECLKIIQQPSVAALTPARVESVNFDKTENLFIEGDNLEVLKLLQNSYSRSIKLVYIDPPYNTDGDFIYPDKYSEGLDMYLKYTGQSDEEGKKFSTASETDGRYHSRWLSMMYPRLYLARNLLKENGAIVTHIDEHEAVHLQMLLDEIFGSENCLGTIVWNKKNPKGDATKISVQHEVILVYARSIEDFKKNNQLKRPKENAKKMLAKSKSIFRKVGKEQVPLDLEKIVKKYNLAIDCEDFMTKFSLDDANVEFREWLKKQNLSGGEAAYKNIDKNGNLFRSVSMAWPSKGMAPKEYFEPLIHPGTNEECPVPERGWRNPPETMKNLYDKELIIFGTDASTQPTAKYLLAENLDENIPSVLPFGGSDDALLKELGIPFDNPKPVQLAKRLIEYFLGDNGIVLDFFAGSCTSAHACMELCFEQNKDCKFIMVQFPEKLNSQKARQKAGWNFCEENNFTPTIAEISKERIRRAAKRLVESHGNQPSFGFRVFKLDRSNFHIWHGDKVSVQGGSLEEQIEMHVDHVSSKSNPDDILYELLLKFGFPRALATKAKEINLEGKQVFSVEEGTILVCLEKEVTSKLIDALADAALSHVICLDEAFLENDQLKINAVQTFKARAELHGSEIIFKTI